MARFSCVIFDVDGTLTRTNDLIFASFNHVAAKYLGKTFSPKEIVALFGPPEEGALARVLPAEVLDTAMNELCEFYEHHHASMAFLHPGLDGAIALLRKRNVKTAVFTGKGRRTALTTLRAFGLESSMDLIVSGNDVIEHKPHPEGIRKVLKTLAVPAEATVMVGDSLGDLRASRGAHVAMAAVLWDSYERERLLAAGPDYAFNSVPEFASWLEQNTQAYSPQEETGR